MTFSLIIFDCDGTLVDTEPLHNLAVTQLLHEEGLTQYSADYIHARFIGTRFKTMLEELSQETGHVFPADMPTRYVALAAKLSDLYFQTVPGAAECVAEAKARGIKICVGSNGQRDNVLDSLRRGDLKKYFLDEEVFTSVMALNPKPAPDLFLLAAEKMGVAPAQCVVIEDSVPGVRAGAAAGMRTIGLTATHADKKAGAAMLKNAGADEIYESFIHISQALFG